jgi:cardiolipin synthase
MIHITMLSGLGHAVFVTVGLLIYVLGTRIGHQRRHPSAAVGWVLGIIGFPYLFVPLFVLFGTRKFVRPARRQPGPPGAVQGGPPWAAQLLDCMQVPPAARNQRIALHADGQQALQGLLETIASAQRQLDVCTYIFALDDVGRQISRALLEAVRRGVAVRLLVDAVGSMRTHPGLLRGLQRQGVQVRRFMPLLHNPLRGRINLRNHRKLVVADGQRLWSGRRNLACEYFMGRPRHPAWIDLSYEIEGPVAAQAHVQFGTDWRMAVGHMLRRMRKSAAAPAMSIRPRIGYCSSAGGMSISRRMPEISAL